MKNKKLKKKTARKRKHKEQDKVVRLPLKFNTGMKTYEPDLPVRKSNKELKVDLKWFWILMIVLILFLVLVVVFR